MKSALIIFLAVSTVILGLRVSFLQKELLSASKDIAFYEKRNDDLQNELMRRKRAFDARDAVLNEIEQSIAELESKVDLETLERNTSKKTWSEIRPVIDRLKAFRQESGKNISSEKQQGSF